MVRRISIALAVVFAAVIPLSATTIVMPNDDQLIEKTPLIVAGTVNYSGPVDRSGGIWTETQLSVTSVLKGDDPGATVTIREMGGRIDNRVVQVWGTPEYHTGEHVLAFLTPTPRGDYQTIDLFVGKFAERYTTAGERLWYRNDGAAGTSLLDASFQPLADSNVQRDAGLFERYVRDTAVPGHIVEQKNYGVANPELVPERSIKTDWTLISEPTVYRWFSPASWRSWGSQPGYTNGGVNELQTGMSAWTGYSGAKITYSYAGTESGSPGGLPTPNAKNEVVFSDPNNYIAGSFTGSGVLAVGGFDNVGGQSAFTPGYSDPNHPNVTTAWSITEGDLVVQDGVSPATGISSTMLAQILAHELGHTLGFGHSSENSAESNATLRGALMYYMIISPYGAYLRTDDQNAAKWLYPGTGGGGGGGTAPAAPSNLFGTVVNGNQAQLNWTDNASDETSEIVHIAIGTGSFSALSPLGANVTSTTVSGLSYGTSYKFYVTAKNSYGESSPSNTVTVNVPSQTVTASFTVSPASGVAGTTNFAFSDRSTGPITARLWTFGDGATATSLNPSHVYSSAGTYTVTLLVRNDASQSTSTKTITVSPSTTLTAAFNYAPSAPTTDDTIAFTDASSGGAISWNWTFGDGSTSTLQNPSKRYTTAGNYTAMLVVSDGSRNATTSRSISVIQGSGGLPTVVANFGYSPSLPSTNDLVSFTDLSTGPPSSWNWSFGDGGMSTVENPTHRYNAPGTYVVTLTASNAASTSVKSANVVVGVATGTFTSVLPAVASAPGALGSDWKTDLTAYNAGSQMATVSFTFMPAAGGSASSRTTTIAAHSSVTYSNALLDLFGMQSGVGAVRIEAVDGTADPSLKISSRTYTNSASGTYGQFVSSEDGDHVSAVMYIPQLESSTLFRTNIGLVNRSAVQTSATLTLYASNGSPLGSATVPVNPNSFVQQTLNSIFPVLNGQNKSGMLLKVSSSAADAINAYASIVDNRSQDPVYVPARAAATRMMAFVPAVARSTGANDTFWRSDVTFSNPNGNATLTVALRFLLAGIDNRNAAVRTITIPPNGSVTIADIVSWFGAAPNSGSLSAQSSGTYGAIIGSRTYTTRSDGGTLGQSIGSQMDSTFGNDKIVTGLKADGDFRTNLGLVNSGDQAIGVAISLVSPSGATIASGSLVVQPKSMVQTTLNGWFPGVNASSLGNFTFVAHTDTASTMFAYASVVDNASGDPIFVAGE